MADQTPGAAPTATATSSSQPAAEPPPAPRPSKTDDGHFIVRLNVYDVTNTPSEDTNGLVVKINNFTHQLGIGGVFHGGIEVDGHEWSYGYCENGSGVYSCAPTKNPMYQFRATVELGHTVKTKAQIREVMTKIRKEWLGGEYTLLSRNCCHFCDTLAQELGAKPIPSWLNRFAQSADATITFTNEAMDMARSVTTSVQRTAFWLRESVTKMWTGAEPQDWGPSGRQDCLPGLSTTTAASATTTRSASDVSLGRFAFIPSQLSPGSDVLDLDGADAQVRRPAPASAAAAAAAGCSCGLDAARCTCAAARRAPVPEVMSYSPAAAAASVTSPVSRMPLDLLAQSAAAARAAKAAAAAMAAAAPADASKTSAPPKAPHLLDS